jgi:hypothetical protein
VGTSVRTSQETHYVSATGTNRLILFGETVAVYCHAMLVILLNSLVLFFDGGRLFMERRCLGDAVNSVAIIRSVLATERMQMRRCTYG